MLCKYCDQLMPSVKGYKLHHSISHSNEPFQCLKLSCGRLFGGWRSFLNHYGSCSTNLVENVTLVENDTLVENNNLVDNLVDNVNLVDNNLVDNLVDNVNLVDNNLVDNNLANNNLVDVNLCDSTGASQVKLDLRQDADIFVSRLYTKPKLPRQYIQDIVQDVSCFIKDSFLPNLRHSVEASCGLNPVQLQSFKEVISQYDAPFSHLSTEHRRFQYYETSGCYIPPISVKVGEIDVTVKTPNGPLLKTKDCFVQSVPLPEVLKKFLEIPNALKDILSYVNSLKNNSECKENYIQCQHWQSKREKYSEFDIVLPLHTFYDDVEVNNALGSHCDKLGAVYVSIPCLPPECQSTVENIFLASLFETWMREFSDEKVFRTLISQLNALEKDGITVETPEGPRKVFFVSGLLLGDNLGLNSISGLVECFSANYYCRFCKTHKSDMDKQVVEDENSLRTLESFNQDVALNNPTLTGVKKECVFNSIKSFHVSSNYSVDVFHDLSEGVCHYTMIQILKHCIPEYFSVTEINDRIEMLQYGPCDSNKIPLLPMDVVTRSKLKMSGSETILFVKLFGILVGDKIPPEDMYWKLYVKLRELIDVCMSRALSSTYEISLKTLTKEFNEMYLSITGDSLKPKFHNLIHYWLVFLQCGPFPGMSARRFESKHRAITVPAHATESRKDICKTVAIQNQMSLCHRLQSKTSIIPPTVFGPFLKIDVNDLNDSFVKHELPECFKTANCILSPNWVKLKGSLYKPGMIILISVDETGGPVLGLIETILVVNDQSLFVYSHVTVLGFHDQVYGYEVETTCKWSHIYPRDLFDPLPLSMYHSPWGRKFVILRSIL